MEEVIIHIKTTLSPDKWDDTIYWYLRQLILEKSTRNAALIYIDNCMPERRKEFDKLSILF